MKTDFKLFYRKPNYEDIGSSLYIMHCKVNPIDWIIYINPHSPNFPLLVFMTEN